MRDVALNRRAGSFWNDIRNAGGNWKDQSVVRDRNWVTSRQPGDIPAFNQALLELIREHADSPVGTRR